MKALCLIIRSGIMVILFTLSGYKNTGDTPNTSRLEYACVMYNSCHLKY